MRSDLSAAVCGLFLLLGGCAASRPVAPVDFRADAAELLDSAYARATRQDTAGLRALTLGREAWERFVWPTYPEASKGDSSWRAEARTFIGSMLETGSWKGMRKLLAAAGGLEATPVPRPIVPTDTLRRGDLLLLPASADSAGTIFCGELVRIDGRWSVLSWTPSMERKQPRRARETDSEHPER